MRLQAAKVDVGDKYQHDKFAAACVSEMAGLIDMCINAMSVGVPSAGTFYVLWDVFYNVAAFADYLQHAPVSLLREGAAEGLEVPDDRRDGLSDEQSLCRV